MSLSVPVTWTLGIPSHIPPLPHIDSGTSLDLKPWLSWPVLRTWLWYFSIHFLKHNFRHQDLILFHWLPISLNKHVNSGTTVLLFLGRPKEPRTCRLAFQVHVISRLRSYNRARLDIAAVSTALNRIDQILYCHCEYSVEQNLVTTSSE